MRKRDKVKLFLKTVEDLKDLLEIKSTDLEGICPVCLRELEK